MIATRDHIKLPNDPISKWLFWFTEFLAQLVDNAEELEVTDYEIEALVMRREVFMGSMCPAHQYYHRYSVQEQARFFRELQEGVYAMVLRINRHPAMTDDLRKAMGIYDFYKGNLFKRKEHTNDEYHQD
jgi:hypothetical protein